MTPQRYDAWGATEDEAPLWRLAQVGMLYIAMKSNALPSVINFANGDPQLEES